MALLWQLARRRQASIQPGALPIRIHGGRDVRTTRIKVRPPKARNCPTTDMAWQHHAEPVRRFGKISSVSGVPAGWTATLLGGGQPMGVPPADRDPRSFFGEPIRKRRAQPIGPAGDQHDLAGQVQIH